MMKIYEIGFSGLWMGGTSLILAHSQEEAVKLLKKEIENDERLMDKSQKKINESQFFIIHEIDKPKVFYYYNGDY